MIEVEKERLYFADCLAFDVEKARKDGVLVGLSGGLDSSTVTYLCVEALGKDTVMGLILPRAGL